MDKRAFLAIALSFLILLGWSLLFQTKPGETPPPPAPAQPAAVDRAATPPAVAEPAPAPAEPVGAASEEEIRVSTDHAEVVFTNRGGRVRSWKLKKYRDHSGNPIELVPTFASRDGQYPYGVDLDDAVMAVAANGSLHRSAREPLADGSGETVSFRWADGRGYEIEKAFTFRRDSWIVELRLDVKDRGRREPARVAVGPGFEAVEPEDIGRQLHYTGQSVRNQGGVVTRLSSTKQEVVVPESEWLRWAGLEEQFFAALVIPAGSRAGVVIRPVAAAPQPGAAADAKPVHHLMVAVGVPAEGAKIFVGPKKYDLLRSLGNDLESSIWFSSYSLIYVAAKYLFLALLWIHDHVVPNYGLAIILATLALRLALFPLNQYSMKSMRTMQVQMARIQPKVNAIKAKYKKLKDAQARGKMNEEIMALYKKEGVNPMGGMSGCLPMLIQLPILIGFYNVLTVAVELRGAPFVGWIGDLTLKDPLYITPLLMGATMFWQQRMTSTKGGDPMQQRMMMMMPVVFTVMFLNLPSGLVLYWFVNNLLGIGQQWLVNRHTGNLEAATEKA